MGDRIKSIKKLKNRLKDFLDKCSVKKLIDVAEREGLEVPEILKENNNESSTS